MISNAQTYETKSSKNNITTRWLTSLLFQLLEKLAHGQLIVQEGRDIRTFGKDSSLRARVTIHDRRAYRKILFGGSIGAGEALPRRGSNDVDRLRG